MANEKHAPTENPPFERIRRVTGYLTGDVKKSFNDAKQAEERDRVKHAASELYKATAAEWL